MERETRYQRVDASPLPRRSRLDNRKFTAVAIIGLMCSGCVAPMPAEHPTSKWWTPETTQQVKAQDGLPSSSGGSPPFPPPTAAQLQERTEALQQPFPYAATTTLQEIGGRPTREMAEAECRMVVQTTYPVTPSPFRIGSRRYWSYAIADAVVSGLGGNALFANCMTAKGY